MKKILFLWMLTLMTNLFAQPTITQSQFALSIGDVITSYSQTYSAPTEGPAQVWDYSALDVSAASGVNVIDDNGSSLSGLPPSTLCIVSPSQEDCFLMDATGMQRTGIGGSGVSIPYQNHEYILQFPITYGDSIVDSFHAAYSIGSFPGTRTGTTTVQVVGYGTLLLPGSVTINNAMLVRTHEQYTDSVDVGTWNVVEFDMLSHYFYAAGYHGYILLMVSGTANPGGPVSLGIYNELYSGAGLNSYDLSNSLELYPNPVEDQFSIANTSNAIWIGCEYEIVNSWGTVMESGVLTNDKLSFDASNYSAGLYVLNIQGSNFMASQRFIKR